MTSKAPQKLFWNLFEDYLRFKSRLSQEANKTFLSLCAHLMYYHAHCVLSVLRIGHRLLHLCPVCSVHTTLRCFLNWRQRALTGLTEHREKNSSLSLSLSLSLPFLSWQVHPTLRPGLWVIAAAKQQGIPIRWPLLLLSKHAFVRPDFRPGASN